MPVSAAASSASRRSRPPAPVRVFARTVQEDLAEVVLGYLESQTIDPLPFLRMATEDPEACSRVLKEVLGRVLGRLQRRGG